ncbi:hypothetical protein N7447_002424 [Penicillium robsamsonii]|uniref:uncharacterized protein n=1 Tax=Penicillium robsamsonii TaxID=1792511 RepID=UPI0025494ABF|nr:uncharacterized protein N7447_002424 [Penicillium robsamsonii]KAJ5836398.1 hypothetical protein N7447_002424 [Penicillium robsamsonii]
MTESSLSQPGSDPKYRATLLQLAAIQCKRELDDIEDIYPCTPAQEGLFALSVKRPNSYVARYVYELPHDVELSRFRNAIDATLEAHTILRTTLIQANAAIFQVVVRRLVEIDSSQDNVRDYLLVDSQQQMPPGGPLLRVALINGKLHERPVLVLTLHHALYDDWSLNVILKDIEKAYDGKLLARREFSNFTTHALHAQSEESAQYWRSRLKDSVASQFPRLPSDSYTPAAEASMVQTVSFPRPMTENEQSAAIELSWAILLSKYTASEDITFGVTLTGRQEHLPGIKDMSGPTIATIPFRVQLPTDLPVEAVLKSLMSTADEMLSFEQRGLYHISRLNIESSTACQFQSLVVIQSPPQYQYDYLCETTQDHDLHNHATFGTYTMTLVCDLRQDAVRVQAVYDDSIVPAGQMRRILGQLSTLLQQITGLTDGSSTSLKDLNIMSQDDIQELKLWNGKVTPTVDVCLHELILKHCQNEPQRLAICAWDGCFTYKEIDDLSKQLAVYLFHCHAVRPETFVPVYFEKSKYTTIAILAVMRTGAAFVLLDPATPLSRNKSICDKLNATCVLSSISLVSSAGNLADNVILVGPDETLFAVDSIRDEYSLNNGGTESLGPNPSNALYAVFTSGSTGTPKGVVIENAAFTTSTKAYIETCHIDREIRALQFASYAFDVSISDTLVTLAAGGCICVPSEEERKSDIAVVVNKYDVNWADFTPSLLRHLSPDRMPSLRTVVLGGEPMSQVEIETWGPHVRLLNIYGPAECCVLSTIQTNVTQTMDPRDIGFSTGGTCWVVDPKDPNQLMLIGAVGELLIEGAIVGRGYLNDEDKTAASFINSPSWIRTFRPTGTPSRFYRTGDLVQYTDQGSLRYVGRRDAQVKLRGQRVELEEVEYHTLNCFPDAEEVVADVLSFKGGPQQLVAFVTAKERVGDNSSSNLFLSASSLFHESVATANEAMSQLLPSFMIPSIFLPVTHIPRTMSDKTDRRRLRQNATILTRYEVEGYCLPSSNVVRRPPVSGPARRMQTIWAEVLRIPEDRIGLDDGFFQIGGDSITAMKVAGMAKSECLTFSMTELFRKGATLESLVAPSRATKASPKWDWMMETALDPCIVSYRTHRICLTGSTGFLGQELLRQLNVNYDVQVIHCLAMRTQGVGVARKSPLLESEKIHYHVGDISLPNLGMEAAKLSSIIQGCDVIIHCAAEISFVKSYELLKATNFGATKLLANLALQHSVPFHFVSSAALSHWTGLESMGEISLREYTPTDGDDGYLTSKWVSETYLENCNVHHGLPVTIHRISSIVGPGAPKLDITNNVLQFSCRLQAVPNVRSCKGFIDLISIQTAASNIMADALTRPRGKAPVKFVNESGEVQIAASSLKEYLENGQGNYQPFEELELEDWVRAAQGHGMSHLVGKFLLSMPPSEIDIAMPFLITSRDYEQDVSFLSACLDSMLD